MSPSIHSSRSRHSQDPISGTTTLHDEPVDMPLKEKLPVDPNPEAAPDRGIDNAPSPRAQDAQGGQDVIIVNWDGPNDPENPKK